MFVFFFLEATDGSLCRFGVLPLIESHLNEKNAVASLVWPDTAFCYFLHCSTRFDIGRKFSTRFDADRHFSISVNASFSAVRPAFRHWQEIFCLVRRGSTRTKIFLRYSTRFDTSNQKAYTPHQLTLALPGVIIA